LAGQREGGGMSAHTPGPWRISDVCEDYHNADDTVMVVADQCDDEDEDIVVQVAECTIRNSQAPHAPGAKRANANARLIVAAPELLEALKHLKHAVAESVLFNGAGCTNDYLKAEKKAAAAIAKATGANT
jgi:hypothetical protein